LPINEESELDTVSFSAWQVKKIMAKLSELADILFHGMDITHLREWQHMLLKYLNVIKRDLEDFGADEVDEFQDLVDE
jgi:hypothetical protein